MAIKSYISHEIMQTKSDLRLQNPSMIHKIIKEKISGQSDAWIMRSGVIKVKNGVWYRQEGKMDKGQSELLNDGELKIKHRN